MRSNIWLFLVMAAYFTIADIGYGVWSYLYFGASRRGFSGAWSCRTSQHGPRQFGK